MNLLSTSTCVITEKIEECKKFYTEKLGGKITFDCGWYVSISLGNSNTEIQFMSPRNTKDKPFMGQGLTFNISVEDVDKEYSECADTGAEIVSHIEDNPWGDRSFVMLDPIKIRLYVYSDRVPSEEFKNSYINNDTQ